MRRIAKFLVLAWNAMWAAVVVVWLLNPAIEAGKFSGGPATTGFPREYPPTKPPDWQLFQYWFVGLVVVVIAWAITRWLAIRSDRVK